jgi:hypothetical protein
MLIYRLAHYLEPIPDIDIGLEGRDKELCKPLRQLFWSSKDDHAKNEIENALDQFLKKKKQNKKNMFEVALLPTIAKLISTYGLELRASLIWQSITEKVEGTYDQIKQPNDYHIADFGTIYRSTITTLICDKFGAEKRHTNKGSILIFDLDKFVRACKMYELDKNEYVVDIQTKLDNISSDGSDGSDGQ